MPYQPNRKEDCPENCEHECPTGLLNWPPSRGPKPFCMTKHSNRPFIYPEPEREDIKKPLREPIAVNLPWEAEKEIIEESTTAEGKCWKSGYEAIDSSKNFIKGLELTPEEMLAREKEKFEKKQSYSLNYHVKTVASLTVKQADSLLLGKDNETKCLEKYIEPGREIEVLITYPLSLNVLLKIKPYDRSSHVKQQLTVGYVLWLIAKEYERIYIEHEKYGIWGHEMGDLYFEQLSIQKNKAKISIGS